MPRNRSPSGSGADGPPWSSGPRRDEPRYRRCSSSCAEAAQIRDHPVAILGSERLVERRLRQGFAQELRDVPVEIGARFTKPDPASRERAPGLEQVGALTVGNEDLDGHPQFAAVRERRVVMMRDPHRPGVEIEALVERRGLRCAILFAGRAAAHCEHATARPCTSFQHTAVVADLAKLVRHGETRDSSAEDEHTNVRHAAGQVESRLLRRAGQQAEARHRLVDERGAACGANTCQEPTSREIQSGPLMLRDKGPNWITAPCPASSPGSRAS